MVLARNILEINDARDLVDIPSASRHPAMVELAEFLQQGIPGRVDIYPLDVEAVDHDVGRVEPVQAQGLRNDLSMLLVEEFG